MIKNKKIFITLLTLVLFLSLSGCSVGLDQNTQAKLIEKDETIALLEKDINKLNLEIKELRDLYQEDSNNQNQFDDYSLSDNIYISGINVVNILKDRDMDSLSDFIHPDKGLRFTPYTYVQINENLVFQANQIQDAFNSLNLLNWGFYDGSGDPISLSFEDYYDVFVYDVDFANPEQIGHNIVIGTGNTTDNAADAYPDASFLEFYFSGFEPEYQGIDWKSLKLVFEFHQGSWYLVGIVHGQWTI